MLFFRAARELTKVRRELEGSEEIKARLLAENEQLEKALKELKANFEECGNEYRVLQDQESRLWERLKTLEELNDEISTENSQIREAVDILERKYLNAVGESEERLQAFSDLVKECSNELTANFVLESIQELRRRDSAEVIRLKEMLGRAELLLSEKEDSVRLLTEKISMIQSRSEQERNVLAADILALQKELSLLGELKSEQQEEFNKKYAQQQLMLEAFSNITPEHALVLHSIEELKGIREQLLKGPVIEAARRKIKNAISEGRVSYEEARERELKNGVLTAEQIDIIYQERRQFMPSHDTRKTIIISDGVNTQGGHDPFR